MATTFSGTLPIEVSADAAGRVCVKQTSAAGEEQVVMLELEQAEHLANWCIQYAKMAVEDLMED